MVLVEIGERVEFQELGHFDMVLFFHFGLVVELHADQVSPVNVVFVGHARVADITGMSQGLDQKLSIVWLFIIQVFISDVSDVIVVL